MKNLVDVTRLLEQCEREDQTPASQHYLHTSEIYRLLGVSPAPRPMHYSRWVIGPNELPGVYTQADIRTNYGATYMDCDACNYVRHQCGGCGQYLNHDGTESAEYGPEYLHRDRRCQG